MIVFKGDGVFQLDEYKSRNFSIKGLKMDFKKINFDTGQANADSPPSDKKRFI